MISKKPDFDIHHVASDSVTVEMHQQPGDRSCANEAIGGAHWGPVQVYMAKVSDATTAVGSSANWFKVSEMGLPSNNPEYWATQVLNDNCGHYTFTVPDIAPGQYLLRAEVIGKCRSFFLPNENEMCSSWVPALHVAGSVGGAQFYMSCFQLNVGGSGTANPPTVKIPGVYSANDPVSLFRLTSETSLTSPLPAK